jgi:hypothetical protein
MKKNDKTPDNKQHIKEFSVADVKSIYKHVDEKNGLGIDYAIRLHQIDRHIIKNQ